ELMQVPIPYERFKRYMRQAFKIIESKESTSESLQTALTTVAEMEQTGLHDDELEERIEKIMAKYGRIPKSELQENIRIRKEFKEELERNAKDPNYDPYRDYKKRSTMGWLAF
ncbi:MAG TPA: hypothetical protein VJH34_04270, partial [archaeon]|nr:hypothetical protein [archaeon]